LQKAIYDPEVEIIACQQLTPDLAERIRCAQYVIFADASTEAMGSDLSLCRLKTKKTSSAKFSHAINPQALVAMARTLYGTAPCASFLLTARAFELGYSEELSPEMNEVSDKAFERVLALCAFLSPSPAHLSPECDDDLPLVSPPRSLTLFTRGQYA
jgi:hydrogenase maturation protease